MCVPSMTIGGSPMIDTLKFEPGGQGPFLNRGALVDGRNPGTDGMSSSSAPGDPERHLEISAPLSVSRRQEQDRLPIDAAAHVAIQIEATLAATDPIAVAQQ